MTLYNSKAKLVVAMIQNRMQQNDYNISDISRKTGVTRSQIHNWLNGSATNIRESSLNKVAESLSYTLHTTNQGITLQTKNNNQEDNEENMLLELQTQIAELQKDKIRYLEEKIIALEKNKNKKTKNIPLWNDIAFDAQTKQVYKKGRYDTFEKYEMVHYQDFYKKLGYSEEEAEKYWKIHKDFMTTEMSSRGTNYNAIETMGFIMNLDKTDFSITDGKETQRHFEMAIKNNIVNQLQIYNACYIGKDGKEYMAICSVLFNFTTFSSKTKIKFFTHN
jgi:transcriptional regulator with XRE-family HTH domain